MKKTSWFEIQPDPDSDSLPMQEEMKYYNRNERKVRLYRNEYFDIFVIPLEVGTCRLSPLALTYRQGLCTPLPPVVFALNSIYL